jgi:Flp pilus assembly protein TadB
MKLQHYDLHLVDFSYLPLILSFISSLLVAYVISWLFSKLAVNSVFNGVMLTLLFWFVFNAFKLAVLYSFQHESPKLLLINISKSLVIYIMYGIVLSLWRKRR